MGRKPHEGQLRDGILWGLLPRLTPASVLGMCLFFFFAAQLFTADPLQGTRSASRRLAEDGGSTGRGWRGGQASVSSKSHAYLRGVLWNTTAANFTMNVSSTYEDELVEHKWEVAGQESFYKPWIEADLSPWKQYGITKDLLEGARAMQEVCKGDMIRFQIVDGSLWVYHVSVDKAGWYPAELGPGNVAAKGRVPYALLAIMETLRMFPGQIPNLDAVLQTADFPCVPKHGAAVPIFGYQGSPSHYDLPFPDYAYWGHEYQNLQDPWGNPIQGWEGQRHLLVRKYENISLLDRIPQAMWRGRTQDKKYPNRDQLRRTFVSCPDIIRKRPESLKSTDGEPITAQDAVLINVGNPPVALQDHCDFRYPMYIESGAYSSNLKAQLACGSVVVALKMQHWEFFARALQAGKHYVEASNDGDHVCEDIIPKIKAMNAMFDTRGQASLRSVGELTPTMEAQVRAMRSSKELSRLLEGGSALEAPLPGNNGNFTWGSPLLPWEIAANGQQFVRDHLRMEDTLIYIRDLLKSYASLQKFKVRPHANARCYTGDLLLEQFGTPYRADGETVRKAYPWLKGYDGGCKAAEEVWGVV